MRCPCVCVLFVSSRSDIVFNPIVSVITDQSQSAKDIARILSPSSMWRTSPAEKMVCILPYSKPEERVHDRYYISDVGRIRTHNLLIVSPAYYHLAITTDYLVIIRVNTLTISLL